MSAAVADVLGASGLEREETVWRMSGDEAQATLLTLASGEIC